MADFYLKVGDRLPVLRATLQDDAGDAVDLSAAESVVFYMRPVEGGTLKVDGAACVVVTPGSGVVEYAWAAADTDTAGSFYGEFRVTYSNGKSQRVPNASSLLIEIAAVV